MTTQRQTDTPAFKEGFGAYVQARKLEEVRGPDTNLFVPVPYKQRTKEADLWIKGWTRAERAAARKAREKAARKAKPRTKRTRCKAEITSGNNRNGERTAAVPDKVVVPSSRGRVLKTDTPSTNPYYVRRRDKRFAPKDKKQDRLIKRALKDSFADAALGTKRGWYELYLVNRDDGNGFDTRRYGCKLYTFNEWLTTEGKKYKV